MCVLEGDGWRKGGLENKRWDWGDGRRSQLLTNFSLGGTTKGRAPLSIGGLTKDQKVSRGGRRGEREKSGRERTKRESIKFVKMGRKCASIYIPMDSPPFFKSRIFPQLCQLSFIPTQGLSLAHSSPEIESFGKGDNFHARRRRRKREKFSEPLFLPLSRTQCQM